jgi:hypothetical protein
MKFRCAIRHGAPESFAGRRLLFISYPHDRFALARQVRLFKIAERTPAIVLATLLRVGVYLVPEPEPEPIYGCRLRSRPLRRI